MLKNNVILIIVCIAIGAAVGYYIKPDRVETKIQTVEVVKEVKDTKTNEVKVEVIKPDGTRTITTHTNTETKTTKDSTSKTEENRLVENKKSTLHVSLLSGVDSISSPTLIYGGSISKNVLGPISVGGFGFTNGLFGVSIGLNF